MTKRNQVLHWEFIIELRRQWHQMSNMACDKQKKLGFCTYKVCARTQTNKRTNSETYNSIKTHTGGTAEVAADHPGTPALQTDSRL